MNKQRPIYSMAVDTRRQHAQTFAGRRVKVVVAAFRSSTVREEFIGTCLGVGVTNNGTAAHQLVMDIGRPNYLRCLSLATVLSIEPVSDPAGAGRSVARRLAED